MCVIARGKKQKKAVTGWKLFYRGASGSLFGLYYGGPYKKGKKYTSFDIGPGFQAFVHRKDALKEQRASYLRPPGVIAMFSVLLYGAQKGIIDGMSGTSNGKPGWCASKMRILRASVKPR